MAYWIDEDNNSNHRDLEHYESCSLDMERSVSCPFICVTKFGVPLVATMTSRFTKGKKFTRMVGSIRKAIRIGIKPVGKIDWAKTYLPKLHTVTRDSSLIVVDPDGSNQTEAVREQIIAAAIAGKLSPFVSNSGSLKAFIPVVHVNHRPSRAEMMATLSRVMGEEFAAMCDVAGIDSTFLNRSALEAANEAMTLEHHELVMVKRSRIAFSRFAIAGWIDRMIDEAFRCFAPFVKMLMNWTKRGLSGTLQIPRDAWAAELGVAPSTITRWIAAFIENGWLACLSNHYVPGRHGKTYCFTGTLKEIAKSVASLFPLPSVKYLVCMKPKNRPECPSFVDGSTHEATLHAAKFARSKEIFESWFKSNTGWNLKGRWERAKSIWNCKARKFGLATF